MTDALDIIADARRDAAAIAVDLLGPPNKLMSTRSALKWGAHGSMTLTIAGPHAGKWASWETGLHGDILDLVERELRLDRRGALRWLSERAGGVSTPVDRSARQAAQVLADAEAEQAKLERVERAKEIWANSVPISSTMAETYLRRRLCGIAVPAQVYEADALRWNPDCRTFQGQPVPGAAGAMIAKMTDPITGQGTGVHRTFIDADGKKLARGMLGTKGVCRLWGDDTVTTGLAIGEGIETVLSGAILLDAQPAWAALDAGALAQFPVLPGIEVLTVLSDNDAADGNGRRAGPQAARTCADRWVAAGREAHIRTPRQTDHDFNSMLTALASRGVAA